MSVLVTLGDVIVLIAMGLVVLSLLLLWLAGLVIGAVERVKGWFRRSPPQDAPRVAFPMQGRSGSYSGRLVQFEEQEKGKQAR
jgi:hypothetical protein